MSTKRELTPPFDGAVDLPVREGWYPCAVKEGLYHAKPTANWPRRYWDGRHFSGPCHTNWSNASERSAKGDRSFFDNRKLQWCGLTAPYSK